MREKIQKHRLKIAFIVSLIIHLILLLSYESISTIQLFPLKKNDLIAENRTKENRIKFDLVETPEDARSEPPEHAELVSDKNSRARDNQANKNLPTGDPYSEGIMDVKELPVQGSVTYDTKYPNNNYSGEKTSKDDKQEQKENGYSFEKFSRQQLMKDSQQSESQRARQENLNKPIYNNRKFRAEDLGGFTFNTYDWDFAPYMLAMKKKVERNIFPPPAFTQMGLISGQTQIRFKVMPNGELTDLKVLKYVGHESLKETSVQALLNSTPFKPLPADFPENYLEVTANFSYFVSR